MSASPTEPSCPGCGAVLPPGLRFCTSCGRPTSPPAPPAGAEPPGQGPWPLYATPPDRNRGRWAFLALAGLLLVGVVVGAVVLLTGSDDDGNRAVDRDPSESRSSTAPDEASSGGVESDEDESDEDVSASVEPPTSPSVEASPAVDPVTCWDGVAAQSVAECSQPEGRAGLEYVFPSMAGQDCRGIGASPSIGRTALVQCVGYLDDGTEIKINYSRWETVADGVAHYDGKGLLRADAADLYGWSGQAGRQFNAAFIYRDEPFSASWYAPTAEDMGLALSTSVVEGKPAGEVRGEPTD